MDRDTWRVQLVPTWHRAYLRGHPLGLAVAIGIFLGGMVNLFAPDLVRESAPNLVLPDFVLLIFNLCWTIGGALATIGLLRGVRNAEVPGLMLTAGGLGAYYVAVISIRATSALTAIFVATLAIGCAVRAWHLTRCGYEGESSS
jgi:hypothetical protein